MRAKCCQRILSRFPDRRQQWRKTHLKCRVWVCPVILYHRDGSNFVVVGSCVKSAVCRILIPPTRTGWATCGNVARGWDLDPTQPKLLMLAGGLRDLCQSGTERMVLWNVFRYHVSMLQHTSESDTIRNYTAWAGPETVWHSAGNCVGGYRDCNDLIKKNGREDFVGILFSGLGTG